MNVLTYDEVIKKVTRPWLLFCYFLKDLMHCHTHAKFLNLGLTGLVFMMRDPFAPIPGYLTH